MLDVSQSDSGRQQVEPTDVQRQMSQEEVSGRSAGRRSRITAEEEQAEWELQGYQVTSVVLSREQPRVRYVKRTVGGGDRATTRDRPADLPVSALPDGQLLACRLAPASAVTGSQ